MIEFTLRPATPTDVSVVFELIKALAEYEKLSHAVVGSADILKEHLFGSKPYAEVILVECAGQAVGFALFFYNYSTVLTQPGIYLEDLFVLPAFRRMGIGKAILSYLAQLVITQGGGRLEWSVLDWNEPAIAFYRRMGASILETSRICRITGDSLTHLANRAASSMVRSAVPADVPMLFRLLHFKAEVDKQSQAFAGNVEALRTHLFGSRNYAEAILVEQAGQAVGASVFFYNYSTFLTKPGLFLDSLFILPEYQHQDIGEAMLAHLAHLALTRGCGRVEWLIEGWESATAFYENIGAFILPDWRICRVTGESLPKLAASSRTLIQ